MFALSSVSSVCVCVGVCGAMNLQGHKVQLAYGGCILLSVNGLNY